MKFHLPNQRPFHLLMLVLALFLLAGCQGNSGAAVTPTSDIPANAIQISIVYAPESAQYLPQTIEEFNRAYREGRNPLTGQALAQGERPIYVTGRDASSGTVMQGIVNAILAPNNQNVERPTIFAPSVSHWLALANFQAGRELFDLAEARPTALAPVVMAIWESRLNAIRQTVGYDDIGWEELLMALNSPNGWQDFGIPNGRRTVFYGHTDPFISSTALSTLIAEFYAAARTNGFTGARLTLDVVRDPDVQQGVRNIEQLIRHYSRRTTEFRNYIAQGPDYVDFVALEENDLIYINTGRAADGLQPPERLVALYPKEGTFWHEHPFGIVNADWVTPEQAEAARVFTDYVLTEPVQQRIMEQGFRPVNNAVQIGFPFVEENGVDPAGPTTVLDVPAPEVIVAIQESWAFVKKQADIWLIMDISGSMESDGKMEQARTAALAFLDGMEPTNRVGLAVFSDDVRVAVEMDRFETNEAELRSVIQSLRTEGGTELFMALTDVVGMLNAVEDDDRIRAAVLLSDGADTGDEGFTRADAIAAIEQTRNTLNPVIVIPIAYGSDADVQTLNSIARSSNTQVQSGDPENISNVLEIISSYF
ncbi:MAG: substrate-binding domain-containing protein [bacterium]|nr:substrate-binding domain-containing protein [bacterium]